MLKKLIKNWQVLCSLLVVVMGTNSYAAPRWSGYLEGIFNTIGSETYTEAGTFEKKETEGNKYWAEAGIKYKKNSTKSEINLDAKFKITDLAYLEFSVKEASIKTNYENWKLSYGRVYVNWNDLDRNWQLGSINNRVNFDLFDSEQEGLVGVLATSNKKTGFSWEVFASGLYVPELNPGTDIDEDERTLTPKSAWAKKIADTIELQGELKQIQYDVETPPIDEILLQYSAGVRLGYKTKHMSLSGFAMRKPENTITLGAGVNLDTSLNAIVASIEPRSFYHNLFGADFSYKFKNNITFKASTLFVSPEQEPEDQFDFFRSVTNLKSGKRRENYWGASLGKSGKNYRFIVRYIARVSDFDRTDDVLAENPRWNQAINVFAQFIMGSKLRVTFDGKYDTLAGDRLVSLDMSYKMSRRLVLRAGVKFIGTDENEISFWSPFANNDSVYTGARLLF